MNLDEKTRNGLRWIVGILDKHQVPYRIGGGLAAHVYGSPRAVNDIDVSTFGNYFKEILPDVAGHITAGPQHYLNEKWDCDTLSLEYEGQEIDITDNDTLKMTNKEKTEWLSVRDRYRLYAPIKTNIEGIEVSLIDPRDLIGYKKHLDGDHQQIDIEAVEKYLATKDL